MTATHPEQPAQYPSHYEPPHGSTWRLFFGPGLVRGAWMGALGFLLGTALVCLLRWWWSWTPVWDTQIVLVVGAQHSIDLTRGGAPQFYMSRVFTDGTNLYQVYYLGGTISPTDPNVLAFFDSLQLPEGG